MANIYCYIDRTKYPDPAKCWGLALAADGTALAYESGVSETAVKTALGVTGGLHHSDYDAHYGSGEDAWTIVWVDNPVNDTDLQDAIVLYDT